MNFVAHTLDIHPGRQELEFMVGTALNPITLRVAFDVLAKVNGAPLVTVFDEFERHRPTLEAAACNAVRRLRARAGDTVDIEIEDLP